MIKQFLGVVLGIIGIVVVMALRKPDSFRVERSATIKAPPERIFALMNDFHHVASWSPRERLDPKMTRTITGASTGKGAVYEWSGNRKAGAGRLEIIESVPSSRIVMRLDVRKPFPDTHTAECTLNTQGALTRVTWAMYGPSPFLSKIMQVFYSPEKVIGGDFTKGLALMKTIAEKP